MPHHRLQIPDCLIPLLILRCWSCRQCCPHPGSPSLRHRLVSVQRHRGRVPALKARQPRWASARHRHRLSYLGNLGLCLVPSIDPVVRQHVTGTGTHTNAPTTVGQSFLPSGTVPPIISGSHSVQQTQAMEPASISAAQRKRTITADELAAEEAACIGSTSGKRQRRPAAKVK